MTPFEPQKRFELGFEAEARVLALALSQFAHLCGRTRGATLVPVPSQNDALKPKPHLALECSELSSLHSRPDPTPGCRWAQAGPW